MLAIPPATDFHKLNIVEGRDLLPGETDTLVANTALLAKRPEMKVGRVVTIRMGPAQTSWRVVGISREPFSPPLAYVGKGFIEARHQGMANSVQLKLDKSDPKSIESVKAELDKNFELEGIQALASSTAAEGRYGFDQHMLMIYIFLIIMAAILSVIGGLGLMTTMSLNVLERGRGMGLLRAIGATPALVWFIVMAEGIVIGVLSWALAALAAWPFSKILGDTLVRLMFRSGLDFTFEPIGLTVWLLVSTGLAAIASFVPAWHASRSEVRDGLN